MKKLLALFLLLIGTTAHATVLDSCMQKIYASADWKNDLFDKTTGIFNTIDDSTKITENMVNEQRTKIYPLIAKQIITQCSNNIADIAKVNRAIVNFDHDGRTYGFDFDMSTVFEYLDMRTAILVIDKRNLLVGSKLKLSDIPEKQKFFTDECSEHTIWDNLDDDAAVNIAGQSVFNEFGGSSNEFFLDFAEGDNRRAFPGLVLRDKTGSTEESIVIYRNLKIGLERANQFAEKLKNSACSDQRLAVYLVSIQNQRDSGSNNAAALGTGITTGVGLASATAGTALVAYSALGTTAMVAGGIAAIGGAAVFLIAAPVATYMLLKPTDIEDIKEVTILDGPHPI